MPSYRNSDPRPPIMEGTPPPTDLRIPLIDWDRAPWNRWTFQHVREVLPTAAIRRSAEPSPLPHGSPGLDDFTYPGADGNETTFGRMLDETYTDAIFVWKDGRVLHESYHNGMSPQGVHLLQSVSKSVTSATAGTLVGEGLLDPARKVTDYLPELAQTGWAGATLQQVLDMTDGTSFDESYSQRDSDVGKLDYSSGWKPAPHDIDARDWPRAVWDQILTLNARDAGHGEKFRYRSIATDVLAHAMERVTGERLPTLISTRLWQPMGAEEDASITVDSAGYGLACGGISASLRDMARFGLMMLNEGRVEGRQVVPASWCRDIRHGKHGLFNTENGRNWPNGTYRNQFWVEDSTLGRHYCFGVFGQMVMVAPDTGFVAVKFSTWPDFLAPALDAQTHAGLRAVESAFS